LGDWKGHPACKKNSKLKQATAKVLFRVTFGVPDKPGMIWKIGRLNKKNETCSTYFWWWKWWWTGGGGSGGGGGGVMAVVVEYSSSSSGCCCCWVKHTLVW